MEFEKQKPISDEYRENWERAFMRNSPLYEDTAQIPQPRYYPNGCPILETNDRNSHSR